MEEAQGRLETARAQVSQAEEGMTGADGELQVIQNQIQVLREEGDRKERRRREEDAGGDDMEDTTLADEDGSSEDVGFREVWEEKEGC